MKHIISDNRFIIKNNMQKRIIQLCIFSIIALGILLRIIFFSFNCDNLTPNGDDEPWARVYLAQQWINIGQGPNFDFGILDQHWIYALHIFGETTVVLYARIIALIFGILLLVIFFYLLEEVYSTEIACYGTFLLSISPLYIHMSTVSLSGGPASFLLISSLYFLIKYLKKNKKIDFVLSLITLNFSAMLRFECWTFIFIFTFILFLYYRFSFVAFLYFICACLYPVVHMYLSSKNGGHPLNAFLLSQKYYQHFLANRSLTEGVSEVWRGYIQIFSIHVFILCILGFFVSIIRNPIYQTIGLVSGLYILMIIIRSMQNAYSLEQLRYFQIPGLLLLIFSGVGIDFVVKRFWGVRKLIAVGGIIFICSFYSIQVSEPFYNVCVVPPGVKQLIHWFKTSVKDKMTYVHLYNLEFLPYITLNLGLPFSHITIDNNNIDETKRILSHMNNGGYIITNQAKGSEFKKKFQLEHINKIFECGKYRVFYITTQDHNTSKEHVI